MRAGAATRNLIFPRVFFPTEGFSQLIHELHARVLVLEGEIRCAVLTLEMTSLPPDEVEALNQILREETGAEQCFALAVHTFSAPHFMPDHVLKTEAERNKKLLLRQTVYTAVREAAHEAAAQLCEVSMQIGASACPVNTARDVETPEGWWIASNGPGPVDHTMTAVKLMDQTEKHVAVLVHYPIQSSVLDGSQLRAGGKAVSGDLAGVMSEQLEEELQCPVFFLIGAAGDQAPREKAVGFTMGEDGTLTATDMHDDAIPLCEAMAAEMADAARCALNAAGPVKSTMLSWRQSEVRLPGKKIERDLHKLHPTRIPPYEPDGENVQTVDLLQVGDLKLIGVKPELNCVTAQEICGGDPMVKVVTLWNGGAKYMADALSCERITYESQNSPFMPGAAEKLVEAVRKLLKA